MGNRAWHLWGIGVVVVVVAGLALLAPAARAGEIHQAVRDGDASRVAKLLQADRSLASAPDPDDRFQSLPLHLAANAGHLEVARLLLDAGAAVDGEDADRSTPLDCAALQRHRDLVELFLARGADPNRRDNNQAYPLSFAATGGDSVIVMRILEAGADLDHATADGTTLLHIAAAANLRGLAARLLDGGLSPDVANREGGTPLGFALQRNRTAMAEYLLDRGASATAADVNGWTPLGMAVAGGNPEIVRSLLRRGADPNQPMQRHHLLNRAAVEGNTEVCRALLEKGAVATEADTVNGYTPLHWAAVHGHADLAGLLCDHGAAVNRKDAQGRTPWQLAARYGHRSAAELLRARGARGARPWADVKDPSPLAVPEQPGMAQVWYLGHSGWAVRTENHLLVFDYWTRGRMPDDPALRNGYLDPGELAGVEVMAFVTHGHRDHYDPAIWGLRETIPGIRYVLGFRPRENQACEVMQPRETRTIDGVEITTTRANDEGVGFLVSVDGVVLFHAGDHANRNETVTGDFSDEIDFVAARTPKIDLCFLPVSGCGFGAPANVKLGVEHALGRLQPRVFFPMHAIDSEWRLAAFLDGLGENFRRTWRAAPENRGDHYLFGNGQVISLLSTWPPARGGRV